MGGAGEARPSHRGCVEKMTASRGTGKTRCTDVELERLVAYLRIGEREVERAARGIRADGELGAACQERAVDAAKEVRTHARRSAYRARRRKKEIERWAALDQAMCCPITLARWERPVMASDGHLYEETALRTWLQNSITSPLTRERLFCVSAPIKSLVRVSDMVKEGCKGTSR